MTMSKKQVTFVVVDETDECTTSTASSEGSSSLTPPLSAPPAADGVDEDKDESSSLLWYSRKDMTKIQTREKLLMEMYTKCKKSKGKGKGDADGAIGILKAYSTLGLLTIKQYRARKAHQREVMMHVIDEQERQIQNNLNDIEYMSNLYTQLTSSSVHDAHNNAIQLEKYVRSGMMEEDGDEVLGKNNSSKSAFNPIISSIKRTMSGGGRKKIGLSSSSTAVTTTTVTTTSATPAMSSNLRRQRKRFLFRGGNIPRPTKV